MADSRGTKTLTITGLGDLEKGLARLSAYAEKDVIQNACKKAAQVVADDAKELVPERTGRLKRAIRVRLGHIYRGTISALAGVGKKWFAGDTFYGAFQEFGWKAGKRRSRSVELWSRFIDRRARELWKQFKTAGSASKNRVLRARQRSLMVTQAMLDERAGKIKFQPPKPRRQIPGEHYMEYAFDEKGHEAMKVLLEEIRAGLERETKK